MATKKSKAMVLQDRIVEFRRIPVEELMPHMHNWRLHPSRQREVLRGMLQEVGIADALIVYESERQGGLTIIDGHLRAEDHRQAWPCLMTDLDDREADILLLGHDPIAGLAEVGRKKAMGLVYSVDVESEALQAFFGSLVPVDSGDGEDSNGEAYSQMPDSAHISLAERFLVPPFTVFDARQGYYRNFVSDTIAAFAEVGARLYNEAILITVAGSLPVRAAKPFVTGRKLGKSHQNVLIFCKGDWRKAAETCGEITLCGILEGGEHEEVAT